MRQFEGFSHSQWKPEESFGMSKLPGTAVFYLVSGVLLVYLWFLYAQLLLFSAVEFRKPKHSSYLALKRSKQNFRQVPRSRNLSPHGTSLFLLPLQNLPVAVNTNLQFMLLLCWVQLSLFYLLFTHPSHWVVMQTSATWMRMYTQPCKQIQRVKTNLTSMRGKKWSKISLTSPASWVTPLRVKITFQPLHLKHSQASKFS